MNVPVKYASQHVHVKDNLVHTQPFVACTCVLGWGGSCVGRPEKKWAGAGTSGHPLICRRPSILSLLLRKLKHVVICGNQIFLFKSQELASVFDKLLAQRVLERNDERL